MLQFQATLERILEGKKRDELIQKSRSWAMEFKGRRYELAFAIQPKISEITGFPVCPICQWVRFPSEPHDHCDHGWQTDELTEEEIKKAWKEFDEEEKKRLEELENQMCPCGHTLRQHSDYVRCDYCHECQEFGKEPDYGLI